MLERGSRDGDGERGGEGEEGEEDNSSLVTDYCSLLTVH